MQENNVEKFNKKKYQIKMMKSSMDPFGTFYFEIFHTQRKQIY